MEKLLAKIYIDRFPSRGAGADGHSDAMQIFYFFFKDYYCCCCCFVQIGFGVFFYWILPAALELLAGADQRMSDSPSLSTHAQQRSLRRPGFALVGLEGRRGWHLTVFFHPCWPQIVQCNKHQGGTVERHGRNGCSRLQKMVWICTGTHSHLQQGVAAWLGLAWLCQGAPGVTYKKLVSDQHG